MTQSIPQRRALIVRNDLSPFGNQLVEAGYTQDQIKQALAESRQTGNPLSEIIEKISGKQLSPELQRQYKKHRLFELKIYYGVETVDPEVTPISIETVHELIETFFPKSQVWRERQILPIIKEPETSTITVAMVNPNDLNAKSQLDQMLPRKGFKWQRRTIALEDWQKIVNDYVNEQIKKEEALKEAAKREEEASKRKKTSDLSSELKGFEGSGTIEDIDDSAEDLGASLNDEAANGAPVINLVNKILIKALTEGVSDIHVEPQEEYLRIRFRKDGVLQNAFPEEPELPKHIIPAVTSRFKIIANLDIAERRSPQDGRISKKFEGRKVDFRVNSLPSRYGEKIVLRILDNSSTQLGLDKLITDEETLATVREISKRPFGLILVTGPTGSGKSTSLYSILAERNEPGVNISTAEDPIEYGLPGLTQVQVIREKGMDFSAILRAFLRQDPDVILVGETRDKETAKTAIEAALTGHLVLTTLHTNDAAGAIARLDEMGIEPFMVSGALLGVLAQRLMRRVCSVCRAPYTPTPEELARYGLSATKETNVTFYKANTLYGEELQKARSSGTACHKCGGGGYKGRVGVYEFLKMSENLQILINQGAPTERIKELAVEEGMKTLLAYSLDLVRQGYTTFEEVERVTFTDTGLEAELKAKRKNSLTCKCCGAELKPEWMDCIYCMTPRFFD